MSTRDNFSPATKETLAKRVGWRCSNPDCRKLTIGPHEEDTKSVNIGVAAHITAAASGVGAKRYDQISQRKNGKLLRMEFGSVRTVES